MSIEAAASAFSLRDRSTMRDGVIRAAFARSAPRRRFDLLLDLPQKRAKVDAGGGRVLELRLEGEAGDARAWSCDCPMGVGASKEMPCLHASLVAAALTRDVEASADDDVPDVRFACGAEAPSSIVTAAEKFTASIDKLDEGVRVGDAVVTVNGTTLGCDCPMQTAATCLHRVVVDAWARGVRPARIASGGAPLTGLARASEDRPVERTALGEKLPEEDVERFEPLLLRIDTLVAELVCYGLQRSSSATLERIHGLITAARAAGIRDSAPRHAGLGRIVRTLERLVQTIADFQSRLVTTSELDVLRELGILRNLARAIRRNTGALPLSEFAGATQQEYVTMPALDIQGLGFEAWTTPGGYSGVTAFVANLRTGQILTRTNALPADQMASGGWADQLASMAAFAGNSLSYLEVAGGRFLLSGAQVAPDSGRLSGSSKTQIGKRDALGLDDPKLRRSTIEGGADALRIARRLGFDPLGRPPTSPPVALVRVKEIGPATFDRRTQTLRLSVATPSVTLPCVLGYRDDRSLWIDNVEKLAKAPPKFLFCRVRVDVHGLVLEPLTAYFDGAKPGRLERRHLTFKELDT